MEQIWREEERPRLQPLWDQTAPVQPGLNSEFLLSRPLDPIKLLRNVGYLWGTLLPGFYLLLF